MPDTSADRDAVEILAEEFVERHRRGERPALSEYVDRCPDRAAEIRDLFPALVVMEKLKPAGENTAGFDGPAERATERLPDRLGDYRILREVGRGGMGVVYEAEQVSLGRHVALKVLPAHGLLNPTFLERFRREAKAAAKLHHTNIVPVFGVGEADGVSFYAMQFIRGEGLDKVLHDVRHLRRPNGASAAAAETATALAQSVAHSLVTGSFESATPPPETTESTVESGASRLSSAGCSNADYHRSVARIALQAADALAYAHKQGVLHRDVKPSNLLLDLQGTVWITDFGLAKDAGPGSESANDLTHAGDIVGTIRFMAPERFDGQSLPQSDLYALGVTLYEMLTLRAAFTAVSREALIQQVLHAAPVKPSRIDPHIPRDLETIVLKCLAKEPRERYESADALAEDLQRYLSDRPIKARRATAAEQLWRWRRRNPALAGALAAATAIFVVGFALVTWKWRAERTARAEAAGLAAQQREHLDRLSAANDRLERGRAFLRDGAFAQARDEFTAAIRLYPDHSGAWNDRGQLYCQLGLWERAAPDVARALELQPPGDRYRTRFRDAYFRRLSGDVAGYRKICGEMLRELQPTDRTDNAFWAALTACLSPSAADDPQQIVRAAKQHVQYFPRTSLNLFLLAFAHYRAAQYGEALPLLQEAGKLADKPDPMVMILLGMTHFQRGEWDQAIKAITQIGTAIEDLVWKADPRGVLFLPEHETWEGRAVIEDLTGEAMDLVVKGRPHEVVRHVARARAFVALRDPEAAAAEYAWAVAVEPNRRELRAECFRFYVGQKMVGPAAAELTTLAALAPNDPKIFVDAFRVYADHGWMDQALAQHARATRMQPANIPLALEVFRYWAERGEWSKAEAAFAEQLQRRPDDRAALHVECARFYREAKMWDKAATEYATVVELRPDDIWTSWYPYAVLCLRAGRTDEYRRACAQLLDRFETTDDQIKAWRVSLICKLAPQAVADLGRVSALVGNRSKGFPGVYGHCLYREGKYEDAVGVLLKAIPSIQNISHIWDKYFLAMAYFRLGKFVEAERWLLEANQSVSDQKTFNERVSEWDKRLDLELLREEAESLVLGAVRREKLIANLLAKGQWQAALDHLDTQLKDGKGTAGDWTIRGRCHAGLKQWDLAVAAYAKAAKLGADTLSLWYHKAYAHTQRQEWTEALAALDKGEAADPHFSGVWHQRTVAFNGLKQFDRALAAADRALQLGDTSPWLRNHRAVALIGLDRTDDAIRDLSELLTTVKDQGHTWNRRGECYARKHQWREALVDFQEALKLEPENSHCWYLVSAAHLGAGNLDDYRAACAKMLAHFAKSNSARDTSRTAYICMPLPDVVADKDELVRVAKLGVAAFPGNERVLGAALVRAGEYEAGVEQFETAAAKRPRKAWDWLFLAMAHHKSGRAGEARDCLAKAVKWIDSADKQPPGGDFATTWVAWYERVEVAHLRREVEELIGAKAKP